MKAVDISHLSYSIDDKEILRDINFAIEPKEKIALLGSNGSGKSTLIDLITENIKPVKGSVSLFQSTFSKMKDTIGVLYDNAPFFRILKVGEILSFVQAAYGKKNTDETVDRLKDILGISDLENSFFYSLSKGERKKVGIIVSMIHSPSLLIADEPTSFLDPPTRSKYWKIITENENLTVLFTTHLWEEAQRYADKIIFINKGVQLATENTVCSLLSDKYLPGKTKIVVEGEWAIEKKIPQATVLTYNNQHHIFSLDIDSVLARVQHSIRNYSLLQKSLEDIYQYLILNPIR
ncbi:putative metal transport system ATP-binding protein [Flagellimonas maritima]|uniref:Putative metal transport system ATP-binding protein n=1 Tax=Flagellimonas maritima TaxID=1383885 RepID=A0A2Z4LUW3_9FLAO|nr:ABC transporter ATP-binding protein [Allomuricauda aurantiaca]AWX45168.1 putative metal transport system ATP-binding protein [Allomuricauda aurantiaca]